MCKNGGYDDLDAALSGNLTFGCSPQELQHSSSGRVCQGKAVGKNWRTFCLPPTSQCLSVYPLQSDFNRQ